MHLLKMEKSPTLKNPKQSGMNFTKVCKMETNWGEIAKRENPWSTTLQHCCIVDGVLQPCERTFDENDNPIFKCPICGATYPDKED